MANLNLTTANAALKDVYLPVVRDQLNRSNWLLSQVEKNTEDFEGNRAIMLLHVGRNTGTGFRADGGDLPTAGHQDRVRAYVGMKYSYGRIEVTGPTIKTMKSDKGSYVRAVDSEMKGVTDDLKRDWNEHLWSTGGGVLAVTGVTTGSVTVVLAASTPDQVFLNFREGVFVDIGTVGAPTTVASNRQVTAVDRSAKTITISGAVVTTTTAHRIFQAGSGGTAIAPHGVPEIVSNADDDLYGVDTGLYPVWASSVVANGGTLTDTLWEELLDDINIASSEDPSVLVAHHTALRTYAASLKDNKRFTDTVTLQGGFKAVSVATPAGVFPLMRDRDVNPAEAYAINTRHLQLFVLSDWEWMGEDGATLSRVSGKDAYEATLFKYAELATDQRNTHGKITGLV